MDTHVIKLTQLFQVEYYEAGNEVADLSKLFRTGKKGRIQLYSSWTEHSHLALRTFLAAKMSQSALDTISSDRCIEAGTTNEPPQYTMLPGESARELYPLSLSPDLPDLNGRAKCRKGHPSVAELIGSSHEAVLMSIAELNDLQLPTGISVNHPRPEWWDRQPVTYDAQLRLDLSKVFSSLKRLQLARMMEKFGDL
jgi:hypothetical protein